MLTTFFRYVFITICAFYSHLKIVNRASLSTKNLFTNFIGIIFISFLGYIISKYNTALCIITMIFFSYLFMKKINKVALSIFIIIISYSLSLIFLIIAIYFICFIFLLFYQTADAIPYSLADFLTGILQLLFSFSFLQSKRVQKGISLLIRDKRITIGLLLSIFFVTYLILASFDKNLSLSNRTVINLILLFLSVLLLYYWNHRITQTYKEKLRLANEKSLQDELDRQKQEIATLQADNERLAKIVHKDNKLIPAMELTVTEFLHNSSNLNADELSALGQELSERLHNMAKDRQGILQSGQKADIALPQSGLHTVDGMLSFMETRAKEEQITYKIQIDDNIKSLITDAIQEEDLLHLLGDLIDNAIIATRHSTKDKDILIHLGTLQDHFLLEISDSGVPFDVESYQRFGNEQHTTHKEDGGSGIGLMDIWKLKKKYKASLQIYEYLPNTSVYTKKISFLFDRKNHFLLQTYRSKEISYTLTRGDLYVFSYKSA